MSKTCFVIAPIGEPDSDTRERSDHILQYIIRPAVSAADYVAVRADEIATPGVITTQVISEVVRADLVIADLSEGNPNVFYELAVRHAARKPVIQLIAHDERLPFDVGAMRTIHVNHRNLASADTARQEITKQVAAIEQGAVADSPISIAANLQVLLGSDDAQARTLARLFEEVATIRQAAETPHEYLRYLTAATQENEVVVRQLNNYIQDVMTGIAEIYSMLDELHRRDAKVVD